MHFLAHHSEEELARLPWKPHQKPRFKSGLTGTADVVMGHFPPGTPRPPLSRP